MATTTDELLAAFREDVDDPLEGVDAAHPDSECLWSNVVAYRYMTTACDRLARDTKSLIKIATIQYEVDQSLVALPKHILHVESVRLASNNRELCMRNTNSMDAIAIDDYGVRGTSLDQLFSSHGEPKMYVRDYDRSGLRIAPIPQRADALIVRAVMTVAVPLSAGMMMPFLEDADQQLVLMYMKYLAYRKQDADTHDLKRSDEFKAEYNAAVSDREQEFRNIRRTPGVVRPYL